MNNIISTCNFATEKTITSAPMMPLGRFCDPLTASGVKTEQKHMLTQHVMITADDDDDDDKDEEVESTEKKTLL